MLLIMLVLLLGSIGFHTFRTLEKLIELSTRCSKICGNVLGKTGQYFIFSIVKASQTLTLAISKGDTGSSNDWSNYKPNFESANPNLTAWDLREIYRFIKALIKAGRLERKSLLKTHPYNPLRYKVNTNHVKLLREFWLALKENNSNKMWVLKAQLSAFHTKELLPYVVMPNVSFFRIAKLAKLHPILKLGGILKRMSGMVHIAKWHTNRNINKYNRYMFKQLNKNNNNSRIFWNLANLLLHNSTSFKLSCIRKVFPTWYKDLSLNSMYRILKDLNNLNFKKFLYKRKNIPKANGKIRSLGVPTPAWRIHQTGLNMILLV